MGGVLGLRAAKGLSRRFRHGSEQIRGRILLSRGKLSQVDRHAEKYSRRLFGWTETCILPGFHGNLFLELDATVNVSHYNIP